MLAGSFPINSVSAGQYSCPGQFSPVRFGGLADKMTNDQLDRYLKITDRATNIGLVSAPLAPVMEFMMKEMVGDQLHQHRALKDAYEILKKEDLENIDFDQIIGHEDAKRELQEFVRRQDFTHLFEYLYKDDGRAANNAVLLTGPAGTGKTMLAKAVAANLKDAAMVNVHCETLPRMIEEQNAARKFEKRLRKIPEKRIVLFLDEIEVIGDRNAMKTSQREYKTLTWLLKTMDGIKGLKNKELLVIGTTNHPELIDSALRNRFQQAIQVNAPTHDELKQLYDLYLNKDEKRLQLEGSLDMDAVADVSRGLSGRKVEQAIAILKRNLVMGLPDEEKTRLNDLILENKKLGKKAPPLDIKLLYNQDDLLKAIHAAQSSLAQEPASVSKLGEFERIA